MEQVALRVFEFRRELQDPRVGLRGVGVPAQPVQDVPAIVAGLGEGGLDRERAVEARERLAVSPEPEQRVSAVVVRLCIVGLRAQCAVVTRERLTVPPEYVQRSAAVVVCLRIVGLHAQRAVVTRHCFVEAPQRLQDGAVVADGRRISGICGDRAAEESRSVVRAARLRRDDTQHLQRPEVVGLHIEDAPTQRLRLRPFASAVSRDRALHRLRRREGHRVAGRELRRRHRQFAKIAAPSGAPRRFEFRRRANQKGVPRLCRSARPESAWSIAERMLAILRRAAGASIVAAPSLSLFTSRPR